MSKTHYLISDLHVDYYLGGSASKKNIHELLTGHLCPADVLIVAGDISNYSKSTKNTIEYLADNYENVIWVAGNHDMVSHDENKLSIDKVNTTVKSIRSTNAHYLSGNVIDINGIRYGGSMGACDFTYAEDNFDVSYEEMADRWKNNHFDGKTWNLGEQTIGDIQQIEYANLNAAVEQSPNLIVSHFAPDSQYVHPRYNNSSTGFIYFDGSDLIEKLPNGTIWCHGHTHDYFKYDTNGVKILCNPFGYPFDSRNVSNLPKEEFIFEL